MVFRSFYIRLALRVVLLTALIFAMSYCLVLQLYLRGVYMGIFVIISAAELIYFISAFARTIRIMHESILDRDFNLRLDANSSQSPFNESFAILNRIAELFKAIGAEKEIQHRYLEMVVNHVSVGLISFRDDGSVFLVNNAFLELIDRNSIHDIHQLEKLNTELYQKIRGIGGGRTDLVKTKRKEQLMNLALSASVFKLDDKQYKLISLQDITSELSAGEMEAWQKLIRVLTHEIMNSISPIISLSCTLHDLSARKHPEFSAKDWETFQSGLAAIQSRGQGLRLFTQRYRELTHIPTPDFHLSDAKRLIHHVKNLMSADAAQLGINIVAECEDEQILMDEKLMEQVLINLLRNAMDAVSDVNEPVVNICGRKDEGRFIIEVADNGIGVEEADLDKIFVPFYTTKTGGSGIGLSLAQQIVLKHKGTITCRRNEPSGTTFTIVI